MSAGGTPGNKGGTGRPPNKLRDLWRADLETVATVPRQIVDSTASKPMERIAALEFMAKYALPHQVEDTTPVTLSETERKAALLRALKLA